MLSNKFTSFTNLQDFYSITHHTHQYIRVVKDTFNKYFRYYTTSTTINNYMDGVTNNVELLNKLCIHLELKNHSMLEKDKLQILFSAACFLYIGLFNVPPTANSKYAILNNFLDTENWHDDVYLQLLAFTLSVDNELDVAPLYVLNNVYNFYFNLISTIINSNYISIAKRSLNINIVPRVTNQNTSPHSINVNNTSILEYNAAKEHFKNNLKSLI